jgi:hypothetical protein
MLGGASDPSEAFTVGPVVDAEVSVSGRPLRQRLEAR